jgi:hypothetical protein
MIQPAPAGVAPAVRRIPSLGARGHTALLWFAVIWNLVSLPALLIVPAELARGNRMILLALMFPAIGALLLTFAVRAAFHRRKFGESLLELSRGDVYPGMSMNGTIRARFGQLPETVRLQLACIRHSNRKGDIDRLLWEDTREIGRDAFSHDGPFTLVPVSFAIPADVFPARDEDRRATVRWILQAHAVVSGIDYESHYEIPVLESAPPEDVARENIVREAPPQRASADFDTTTAKVQMAPASGGGTEFRYGPLRAPGAAAAWTLFVLIFGGAALLAARVGAPRLFTVPFVLFGLLMLLVAVDLWIGVTVLEVRGATISHRHSWLMLGRTREWSAGEIQDVRVKIGMSQQRTVTQSARAWYDIQFRLASGRYFPVLRHVPSKAEAEFLAGEIRQLLVRTEPPRES